MFPNYNASNLSGRKLGWMIFFAALSAQAQDPQLILASPTANAQTLSLVATLNAPLAGTPISGIEFSVSYSTAEFSSVTVAAAGQSLSAGKQAYCSGTGGTANCILEGLNLNQIGSGPVANCTFVKGAGFKNASSLKLTSALGVTAEGRAVALGAVTKSGQGTLTGSAGGSLVTWNLTKEGTTDWIDWGDSVRKATVTPVIGSLVSSQNPPVRYTIDPRLLSWTDGGSVKTNAGSKDGLLAYGIGNGFQFSVPADSSVRTLIIHVSGYFSSGKLTAQLSDSSATDFVDYTLYADGFFDHDYVVRYNAASAGQSLKVTWVTASGIGWVGVSGAALF